MEFELRTSDFCLFNNIGQLESALLRVRFSKDNILELLMTKDMTENGEIELSNISSDKRSLK